MKATLASTFRPPGDKTVVFSNDLHTAEQALRDGKKTIDKASKRLDGCWHREHQREKLPPMLDAQVMLGQNLRRIRREMEKRKEIILDKIVEEQAGLGSETMVKLLDEVDERWFVGHGEDADRD